MKQLAVLILLFLFFLSIFAFQTQAAPQTLSVTCSSGCIKSGTDPLFSQVNDGYWYPGSTYTKILSLTNSGPERKEMAMRALRTSASSILEEVMSVSIANSVTSDVVWSGSLSDFYQQESIGFGTFDPGQHKDFSMTVSMDPPAGNEYQGTQSMFDLRLGFWTQESSSSTGGGASGTTNNQSTSAVPETTPTNVLFSQQETAGLGVPDVLGAQEEAKLEGKGAKASPLNQLASGTQCQKSWWLLLFLELPMLFFFFTALRRKIKKRRYLLLARFLGGVVIAILWFLFCSIWWLLLFTSIVYACVLFLYREHSPLVQYPLNIHLPS